MANSAGMCSSFKSEILAGLHALGPTGPTRTVELSGVSATGAAGSLRLASAARSGVVIWGRIPAYRTAGKTASNGTLIFRQAA